MMIVTGTLHARPESLAEVMALSRAHVLRSRGERGCLEHGVASMPTTRCASCSSNVGPTAGR